MQFPVFGHLTKLSPLYLSAQNYHDFFSGNKNGHSNGFGNQNGFGNNHGGDRNGYGHGGSGRGGFRGDRNGGDRNGGGKWDFDRKLQKVDFSKANLKPLQKDFYKEHASVSRRGQGEVDAWLAENNVTLDGEDIPRPVFEFVEGSLPGKH